MRTFKCITMLLNVTSDQVYKITLKIFFASALNCVAAHARIDINVIWELLT